MNVTKNKKNTTENLKKKTFKNSNIFQTDNVAFGIEKNIQQS